MTSKSQLFLGFAAILAFSYSYYSAIVKTKEHKEGSKIEAPLQELSVIRVVDGDTLITNMAGKKTRVRLADIDAPENGQPFARQATSFLAKISSKQPFRFKAHGKDKHGRTVAVLKTERGQDVGILLVSKGLAWCFTKSQRGNSYCSQAMRRAQGQKIGIWSQKSPTPPWEFRSKPMVTF